MYNLINNIFQYILGFFFNSLNDIYLFKFLISQSFKHFIIHTKMLFVIFFKYKINKRYYKNQLICLETLKKNKKSDKLFIFGSGVSLNNINEKIWGQIRKYDTIGFNSSFYLQKINFTYYILRAGQEYNSLTNFNTLANEIKYAKFVVKKIKKNIYLKKTIFLFSSGISQHFPNLLIGYKLWNFQNHIYQYNTNKFEEYPKGNLHRGLIHRIGTLIDAITFGYHMNYKEIILVGVDLYDSKYFWAPLGKTVTFNEKLGKEVFSNITLRGKKVYEPHNTVNNGIIKFLDKWNIYFKQRNIKLFIANPRSLLNEVLPIFKFK